MASLTGKIALVTGASRGIGQAIADTLAAQGAYVVGTATSAEGADNITTALQQNHGLGHGLVCDVTQPDHIERLLQELTEQQKLPAILVNNAGITRDNLLLRMDDEQWEQVIATNLTAVFKLTKACIKPMFKARYGRVISVGSVVAASGNPGQCNYTAAKAGLIGFSKSLAHEIASRGITVNVVAPGFIDTDMTLQLPDMLKEEMLKRIPMKRLGKKEDVAEAVAFLASDVANYITGTTLHVNGGMYMD